MGNNDSRRVRTFISFNILFSKQEKRTFTDNCCKLTCLTTKEAMKSLPIQETDGRIGTTVEEISASI
jgi:hypothetical protein